MSGSAKKCIVALTSSCDATTGENFVCFNCFHALMHANGAFASRGEYETCLSEFLKLLIAKNHSVEYRNNGSVINYDIFEGFDLIGFSSYDLGRERSYACVKNPERGTWFLCNDQGVLSLHGETNETTTRGATRGEPIRFSIPEKSANEAKLDNRVRLQLDKLKKPSKTLRAGANCSQRADELCADLRRRLGILEDSEFLILFEPIFLEYTRRQYDIDCPKTEIPDVKKALLLPISLDYPHNIILGIKSCVCTKDFLDQLFDHRGDFSRPSGSFFGKERRNRKTLLTDSTRLRSCRCHGLYFETEKALEDHFLQYIWRVCWTIVHTLVLGCKKEFSNQSSNTRVYLHTYLTSLKKAILEYNQEPRKPLVLTMGNDARIFEFPFTNMEELDQEITCIVNTFSPQHRAPPTLSKDEWETVLKDTGSWLKIHKNTSIKTYPVIKRTVKGKTYYLPLLDTGGRGTFHYDTLIVDIMNVAKQENEDLYKRLKMLYEPPTVAAVFPTRLIDLLEDKGWGEWWHCLGLPLPYEENNVPEGVKIQEDMVGSSEDNIAYNIAHDTRLFTPKDYASWRYMENQQTMKGDIEAKYKQHQQALKKTHIAPTKPFKSMTECVAQASVLIYKRTTAVKDPTVWSTSPPFLQPSTTGVQETALQLAMVYPPCHKARDEETKFSAIFNTIKHNHHNLTVEVDLLGHQPINGKKIYEDANSDNINRKLNIKDLVERFPAHFDNPVEYYTVRLTVEIDTGAIAEALGCDTRDKYRIEDILKVYKLNQSVVPIVAGNREEVYLPTCLDHLFRTIDATVPIGVFRAIFLGREYERVRNIYVTFQPSRNDTVFYLEETSSVNKTNTLKYDYGVGQAFQDIMVAQKALYNPILANYSNLMILRSARGADASLFDDIGPVINQYAGNEHRNAAHINIRPSEYLSASDIKVEKMNKHQQLVWDLDTMVNIEKGGKRIKNAPNNPYTVVKSTDSKWYILYGDYIILTLDRGYAPIPEDIPRPVEDFIAFSKKKLSKKRKPHSPSTLKTNPHTPHDADAPKKRAPKKRAKRAEGII